MPTNNDPDNHAESAGTLPRALRTVAAIGSPLAVGTVLLFYFGWVRATEQARALGYDTTVLELTTADYLLKSISVVFLPLVMILLLSLGVHRVHLWLFSRYPPDSPPAWLGVLARAWLAPVALGMVLSFGIPQSAWLVVPLALTITICAYLYGRSVHAHFFPAEQLPTTTRNLLLVLLALAVFWDTERLARWDGSARAAAIAEDPAEFPVVTIYSKERLLIAGPGVEETMFNEPNSAFGYRCSGLRLVHRSGDRYFLLAVGRTADTSKLVVIKDGDTVRLEIRR